MAHVSTGSSSLKYPCRWPFDAPLPDRLVCNSRQALSYLRTTLLSSHPCLTNPALVRRCGGRKRYVGCVLGAERCTEIPACAADLGFYLQCPIFPSSCHFAVIDEKEARARPRTGMSVIRRTRMYSQRRRRFTAGKARCHPVSFSDQPLPNCASQRLRAGKEPPHDSSTFHRAGYPQWHMLSTSVAGKELRHGR